jgi:hypothetical protein
MLSEYNQDKRYDALQENAIQVIGEEDGVWNDNDYALFYAQGPNGYNLYDTSNGNGKKRTEFRRLGTPNNFINIYEDYSYYFINFDIGAGKRVQTVDNNLPQDLITRYDDYQYINEEKFNLVKLGRTWTGDAIPGNREITFTTRSPIQTDDVIRFKTQVIGYNAQSGKITFNVNGSQDTRPLNSSAANFERIMYESALFNQSGTTIKFNYTTDISANPNASFYFDFASSV